MSSISLLVWQCLAIACVAMSLAAIVGLVYLRVQATRVRRRAVEAAGVAVVTRAAPSAGPPALDGTVPAHAVAGLLRACAEHGLWRPSAVPADRSSATTGVVCSVCLESIDSDGCWLPCGHQFHAACVVSWLGKNSCPMCRAPVWSDGALARP
jgi:hypothetical protein